MAAGKKTGGRQKGVPNKATAARAAEIAASGLTPLDWMLSVLRDPAVDYDRRDKMAANAAPYVHPRLAAVDHSSKDGSMATPTLNIHASVPDSRPVPAPQTTNGAGHTGH